MAKNMCQKRKESKNKKEVENTDRGVNKNVINWYPGHMAKTKREMKEKIDLIDVIYEVVDARMPLSSKIVDIDELIGTKPRILIMTKYDMCDQKETNRIITYYKEKGYEVVPVDLMKEKNINPIIDKSKQLLQEMNQKRKDKGLKSRPIRALIVGVPNAGKSTLINRLVGKKATVTGNQPGVTKSLSWIRINKELELLDSPGILWPKIANQEQAYILASLSSIKEEILDTNDLALFILKKMMELYPSHLKERYGIDKIDFKNIEPTLDQIAKKRGALLKGGIPDYEKVYSLIIRDLKEGLLGKITLDRLHSTTGM